MEQDKKVFQRNCTVTRVIRNYVASCFREKVDLIIMDPWVNCPGLYGNKGFSMVAITDDENFHDIDQNFILNKKYFSIYSKTWQQIDELSEYTNPAVSLLTNFTAIYKNSMDDWLQYIYFHERLKINIKNKENVYNNISKHFIEILRTFDKILSTIDFKEAFKYLSRIVTRTEYIIYMLNERTFPQSQEAIQKEILGFKILPASFNEAYDELISCYSLDEIKKSCLNMIVKIKNLLDDLDIPYNLTIKKEPNASAPIKVPLTSDALDGTSEIISKWQSDMYKAIEEDNRYLSFMTMAKCQRLYNEMYQKYEMNPTDILSHYNPYDLRWNARIFDFELKRWQYFYKHVGKKPNVFEDTLEFENFYDEKRLKKNFIK